MYTQQYCNSKFGKDKLWQEVHKQADYSIVSVKLMKVSGEKGIAVERGEKRDTSTKHRGGKRW